MGVRSPVYGDALPTGQPINVITVGSTIDYVVLLHDIPARNVGVTRRVLIAYICGLAGTARDTVQAAHIVRPTSWHAKLVTPRSTAILQLSNRNLRLPSLPHYPQSSSSSSSSKHNGPPTIVSCAQAETEYAESGPTERGEGGKGAARSCRPPRSCRPTRSSCTADPGSSQ
jgi:hypothetical protein